MEIEAEGGRGGGARANPAAQPLVGTRGARPDSGFSRRLPGWIKVASRELRAGDPYGTRTRVFAVRGRRPRPLDEGAMRLRSGHIGGGARAVKLAPGGAAA